MNEENNKQLDIEDDEGICPKCFEPVTVPALEVLEEYPGELRDFCNECEYQPCYYWYLLDK